MATWRIYARSYEGVSVGRIETFRRATFSLWANDGGPWTIEGIPRDSEIADVLQYTSVSGGNQGVMLTRLNDQGIDEVVFSGRVLTLRSRSDEDGDVLDVTGCDDTARLAQAYVSPDPTRMPPFTVFAADTRTAPAETLLHEYVNWNVGADALALRHGYIMTGMERGTSSGRGSVQTRDGNLQVLLDFLQEIAAVDGLLFAVRNYGLNKALRFETWVPTDRRAGLVFERPRGNVGEIVADEAAARANAILGLGTGEGTARVMSGLVDIASYQRYGRFETTKDVRQADTTDAINVALHEDIATGAGGQAVSFAPLETPGAEFWADYRIGDYVGASGAGVTLDAYVSAVDITIAGRDAVRIVPTITTLGVAPKSDRMSGAGRLDRRIRNLETGIENPLIVDTTGFVDMWGRPIGEKPATHILCDGTSGTPDLRGYMLYGAGNQAVLGVNYSLFATVGGNTGSVDIAHTHNIDHAHDVSMGGPLGVDGSPGGTTKVPSTPNDVDVADDVHEHVADADHLGTTEVPATGSTTKTFDNRPAGKALYFLWRL